MRRLLAPAVAFGLLFTLLLTGHPADARPVAVGAAGQSTHPLVITYTGWGPLRLGMSSAKARRTGMVSKDPDGCAPGNLLAKPYRDHGFLSWIGTGPHLRLGLMIVTDTADHTAAGVHVGDTLGRLKAAYPRLSAVVSTAKLMHEPTGRSDTWVASVHTRKGAINFQFPYGKHPTSSTKIETIVVSRKPTYWYGC